MRMRIVNLFGGSLSDSCAGRLAPQLVVQVVERRWGSDITLGRMIFQPHPIVGQLARKRVPAAPAQRPRALLRFAFWIRRGTIRGVARRQPQLDTKKHRPSSQQRQQLYNRVGTLRQHVNQRHGQRNATANYYTFEQVVTH